MGCRPREWALLITARNALRFPFPRRERERAVCEALNQPAENRLVHWLRDAVNETCVDERDTESAYPSFIASTQYKEAERKILEHAFGIEDARSIRIEQVGGEKKPSSASRMITDEAGFSRHPP